MTEPEFLNRENLPEVSEQGENPSFDASLKNMRTDPLPDTVHPELLPQTLGHLVIHREPETQQALDQQASYVQQPDLKLAAALMK